MNKKSFLPLSILAAVLIGLAVTSRFWLIPIVEDHVRSALDAFNEPSSQVSLVYDQNTLAIDVFSGELHLEHVELISHLPDFPGRLTIRSLDIQFPASLLLLSLRGMESTESMLVLPRVDVQGVTFAHAFGTVESQQLALENVSVDLSRMHLLLAGDAPRDVATLVNLLLVEKLSANTLTFFNDNKDVQGSATNLTINHWKGEHIGSLGLTSLVTAEGTNETRLSVDEICIDNLYLPLVEGAETLSLQLHDADFPEEDIPNLLALGDRAKVHYFDKTVLQKVVFATREGEFLLSHLALDWPMVNPQKISLQINDFVLPTELCCTLIQRTGDFFISLQELKRALSGLDCIHLNARLTADKPDQAQEIVQEKLDMDMVGLGTLSYSHKVDHSNLDISLSDIELNYTDNSLLARLGLLFFPEGQAEHRLLNILNSITSSANAPLVEALKTFVQTPGTLTLTSVPGKACSQGNLFLVLANPTLFFQIGVVPGTTSLKQQTATLLLPQ